MPDKPTAPKKLSDKNTKQEMLEAYHTLAKQLEEKRAAELAPERRLEEKAVGEATRVAAAVIPDGIDRELGGLKAEMGKMLADISDRLGAESAKFRHVQKAVESKERELSELRAKATAFPKELENAVNQAVKEASDRLRLEAKSREDLAHKQFEGERNVLGAKNESLERANKDLVAANAKLAQQIEAAYQKVQDIAEKTVEGSSQSRSLAELQKLLVEQGRKGREEKA